MISGLKDGASHLRKNAMSRNRFCKILRFLSFDIKSNRSQRLQTEKFDLFSEVWNRVIDNCYTAYKPQPFITVDEQFFPSKAFSASLWHQSQTSLDKRIG